MQKQKRTKNDIAGPLLLVSKYEKSSLEQFLNLYGGMETSASADYTNLGILDDKKKVNRIPDRIVTEITAFSAGAASFQ